MKLAIGIPTYNEATTISFVTQQVDLWIQTIGHHYSETVIMLLDSASTDNTVGNFTSTPTQTRKRIIHSNKPGKWKNVANLINHWKHNDFDHLMTFDGDLNSISPDWVEKYAEALLAWSDYVIPIYSRNRYEWSATNHFAAPIVSAYSWEIVRQPLAGDFGIWRELFSQFIEPADESEVNFYGIDIYLTLLAFSRAKKITEVKLPKKIHKPSFPNLSVMFPQIASSALTALQLFKKRWDIIFNKSTSNIPNKFWGNFPHKDAGIKMRLLSLQKLTLIDFNGTFLQDYNDKWAILAWKLNSENWTDILALFFRKSVWSNKDLEILLMIYEIRVVNFWEEIEKLDDESVENLIIEQIRLFSRKYLSSIK